MGTKDVTFTADIRPLFRQRDIDSMLKARRLDLSSYEQVSARANDILERLEAGDMPCDGAWPVEKVEVFRRWVNTGKLR
jgi:hypothetical protein